MAISREVELYEPIKTWLEQLGYTVRSEVKNCDIVAMREPADEPPIIIELKKTFNLALLFQAVERLELTPNVYVAIEDTTGSGKSALQTRRRIEKVCRQMRIGLVTVRFRENGTSLVQVIVDPVVTESNPLGQGKKTKRVMRKQTALLKEFAARSGDHNIGGSNRQKLVTAYREQALLSAYWLNKKGPLAVKQLRMQPGIIGGKVQPILHNNVYGWFDKVDRGTYRINEQGLAALEKYKSLLTQIIPE